MDQMVVPIILFIVLLFVAGATVLFVMRRSRHTERKSESRRETGGTSGPPFGGGDEKVTGQTQESRNVSLRQRLANSGGIGKTLLSVLSRDHLGAEDWDGVEELLLAADVGVGATEEIVGKLRERIGAHGGKTTGEVKKALVGELTAILKPDVDRNLSLVHEGDQPAAILIVGVNGVGKTTTVGKVARLLVKEGHKVVLGAADTFRAAAAEQLSTWGNIIGVPTVTSESEGADPAAVAYKTVQVGIDSCSDVVIVDTAGRLQNKVGLMDELAKIRRVVGKQAGLNEVLLVVDATTGQNGLNQAKIFKEIVDVTGIVLTKLDGTAKGGIVIAIQQELGVPVKLVGLGEGADDLVEFNPEEFAEALVGADA